MTLTLSFRIHPLVTSRSGEIPRRLVIEGPTTAGKIIKDLGLDETEVLAVLKGHYLPMESVIDGEVEIGLYPVLAGG